ncbi:hypothetical protein NUH88_12995 [Nisaea acidiphila]|uniref:Uncharacterized protein n=1 Tax=Nisaea acidiphila TaxID=1862145 RepID=A0A9J7AN00_9PROT|nr:hypothetical protein [Nisaea acidiphila]UUX48330.1 hypothetical protein NUH88_12995 [Nisaea acidiphila]
MISSASAQVVLFGIRSAIKLGQQARAAYIDNTRNRALTLPLPDFKLRTDVASAVTHFSIKIDRGVDVDSRVREIVAKSLLRTTDTSAPPLTDVDKEEILLAFNDERLLQTEGRKEYKPLKDGSYFDSQSLSSLVTVRQWKRDKESYPSAVQRFAGTFIEIGIDYYTSGPGLEEMNTEEEKALLAFLTGFDDVDFAEAELGDLPGRLMTAVLDTISENPEFISDSSAYQDVIKVTAAGLSEKVTALIKQERSASGPNIVRETQVRKWAEEVFRTVLSTAGETVLSAPDKFLGIGDKGAGALVSNVGETVLELVLDTELGRTGAAFGPAGIEAIAAAALETISEHPNLIAGGNTALSKLVRQIAQDVHGFEDLKTPGLTSRIMQVVLLRSGENLSLFWPDTAHDPKKHLLLTAAKQALTLIAASDGGEWRPRLGADGITEIVETLLDEIIENPGWVISKAGQIDGTLQEMLSSVLTVLEERDDARIAPETLKSILKVSVLAAARRAEFLETFSDGRQRLAVILDYILEAAIGTGSVSRESTVLLRRTVLEGLIDLSLDAIADTGLDDTVISKFKQSLDQQVGKIANGEPFSLEIFVKDLRTAIGSQS